MFKYLFCFIVGFPIFCTSPIKSLSAPAVAEEQNFIKLNIYSTNFPESCNFKIDLKLKFKAIDTSKIIAEGRTTPTKDDYLMEQTSINSFEWNISYNDERKPIYEKSPQSVTYMFSKPLSIINNAFSTIELEGNGTLSINEKISNVPLSAISRFQMNTNYVLHLSYIGTEDDVRFGVRLMTDEEFQSLSDGNNETRTFTGVIGRPAR